MEGKYSSVHEEPNWENLLDEVESLPQGPKNRKQPAPKAEVTSQPVPEATAKSHAAPITSATSHAFSAAQQVMT